MTCTPPLCHNPYPWLSLGNANAIYWLHNRWMVLTLPLMLWYVLSSCRWWTTALLQRRRSFSKTKSISIWVEISSRGEKKSSLASASDPLCRNDSRILHYWQYRKTMKNQNLILSFFFPVFKGGARRDCDCFQDAVPSQDQWPREGDHLPGREHGSRQQCHRWRQSPERPL